MSEKKRVYKLQSMGGAYYICLPKVLVKAAMIKFGILIDVLDVNEEAITLRLRVSNAIKQHDKNNKKSGKNTQKLGTANGVRKND